MEDGWKCTVTGSPMFVLCKKLRVLKGKLKEFNNVHFKQISNKVLEAKETERSFEFTIG